MFHIKSHTFRYLLTKQEMLLRIEIKQNLHNDHEKKNEKEIKAKTKKKNKTTNEK